VPPAGPSAPAAIGSDDCFYPRKNGKHWHVAHRSTDGHDQDRDHVSVDSIENVEAIFG
jgi:hypothetical protein